MDDYELIDAGDGRRLERFGRYVVDRAFPAADSPRRAPERWEEPDLRFERDAGWSGPAITAASEGWTVDEVDLRFELRPTAAGQVGVFPEHAGLVPWLRDRVGDLETATVLNLFAYSGLITLALAAAGASVAHVDAAKPSVEWARRNAALNKLDDRPIRWLVDDARSFVAREVRRDRHYDGIVLDPPTYGHGASGKAWRLERDLPPLLDDIHRLLARGGFLLLTAHTEALDPFTLGGFLDLDVEIGELAITATSGAVLHLGAFARIAAAS